MSITPIIIKPAAEIFFRTPRRLLLLPLGFLAFYGFQAQLHLMHLSTDNLETHVPHQEILLDAPPPPPPPATATATATATDIQENKNINHQQQKQQQQKQRLLPSSSENNRSETKERDAADVTDGNVSAETTTDDTKTEEEKKVEGVANDEEQQQSPTKETTTAVASSEEDKLTIGEITNTTTTRAEEQPAQEKAEAVPVVVAVKDNTVTMDPQKWEQMKKTSRGLERLEHFFSHLPKAGGVFAWKRINQLLESSPPYQALPPHQKFMLCQMGVVGLKHFARDFKVWGKGNKLCKMHQSEQGWSDIPDHTYITIRHPKTHTLSQYFHCLESENHGDRAHLIPDLDEWLRRWEAGMTNGTQAKINKQMRCYNPTNFQSRWMAFDIGKFDHDRERAKEDLMKRYRVLGISEQMIKSICLIVTKWAGFVPPACDCTNGPAVKEDTGDKKNDDGSGRDVNDDNPRIDANNLLDEHQNQTIISTDAAIPRVPMRRRLVEAYDPSKDAHGVKHHGSSYQTTPEQDAVIARIRAMDYILYNISVEVFEEQVRQAEEQYQVKLCDAFRDVN